MSTYWLCNELQRASDALTDGGNPVLTVRLESKDLRIYCPDSSEYIVDSDVVEKAIELGASIVAYSSAWCRASYEAQEYGSGQGVQVMPYGALFALLRTQGVRFKN
jgi:hypothetical protein